MTDHEHTLLRVSLGAFVLGGLPPAEAREVEEHLATCPSCRAEHDALLPAVGALADVRRSGPRQTASGELPAQPPGDLGPRILAKVCAEQAAARRRVWLRSASLSAVGAAAAAIVLVVGLAVTRPDPVTPSAVPLEPVAVQVEEPGIVADADLVNHTWGVEVKLRGTGFTDGARYQASVLGTDGRTYPAGQFSGVGATDMTCNLSSSVLRADAAGFEIRDLQGGLVVRSSFAGA